MFEREVLARRFERLIISGLATLLIMAVTAPSAFSHPKQRSHRSAKARKLARAKKSALPKITANELNEARQRLFDLGYWVNLSPTKKDDSFHHALIAFQKVEKLKPTGQLSFENLNVLRTAERPQPHFMQGAHIEVDLTKQVLFLVNDQNQVERILPISSGNNKTFESEGWEREAITPIGRYFIQRKIEGWRKGPLGEMYYPNYILGGLAIHGSPSVPSYPDSHGCVRIPMYAAIEFSRITPIGLEVLIYESELQSAR